MIKNNSLFKLLFYLIKILNNKTKIIINFKINMLYSTVIKNYISFRSLFFKFKDDREISSLNGKNDKTWSVFQLGNFEKWRQKEETFLEIAWRASLVCRIQCIPRVTLLLKKFWVKRGGLFVPSISAHAFRLSMESTWMSSFLKKTAADVRLFCSPNTPILFFFILSLNWNTHNRE